MKTYFHLALDNLNSGHLNSGHFYTDHFNSGHLNTTQGGKLYLRVCYSNGMLSIFKTWGVLNFNLNNKSVDWKNGKATLIWRAVRSYFNNFQINKFCNVEVTRMLNQAFTSWVPAPKLEYRNDCSRVSKLGIGRGPDLWSSVSRL